MFRCKTQRLTIHRWLPNLLQIKNVFKFSKNKTQCIHFCNLCKIHNNPVLKLDSIKIPIVEEHKFLEIIFDKILTFKLHIKYLRSKCNKTIQLLRVIAHTDWGADKKTLLKPYRTSVRSRLDYGTFLKQLNTIHHQGLRLALGAYKTSPIKLIHRGKWTSTINQKTKTSLIIVYQTGLMSFKPCPQHKTFF